MGEIKITGYLRYHETPVEKAWERVSREKGLEISCTETNYPTNDDRMYIIERFADSKLYGVGLSYMRDINNPYTDHSLDKFRKGTFIDEIAGVINDSDKFREIVAITSGSPLDINFGFEFKNGDLKRKIIFGEYDPQLFDLFTDKERKRFNEYFAQYEKAGMNGDQNITYCIRAMVGHSYDSIFNFFFDRINQWVPGKLAELKEQGADIS